jgi:hypothetical protein
VTARLDLVEAAANATVGLIVSWAVTYFALPLLFGLAPSAGQSAAITALFFGISAARSFVLRRVFRRFA